MKDRKKAIEPKASTLRKRLEQLAPLATACRDLVKDVDMVCKLAGRVIDTAEKETDAREHDDWDSSPDRSACKSLGCRKKITGRTIKAHAYFERQAHWLLSKFPDAKFVPVVACAVR